MYYYLGLFHFQKPRRHLVKYMIPNYVWQMIHSKMYEFIFVLDYSTLHLLNQSLVASYYLIYLELFCLLKKNFFNQRSAMEKNRYHLEK